MQLIKSLEIKNKINYMKFHLSMNNLTIILIFYFQNEFIVNHF